MSPACPLCQSTDHKVVYDLRALCSRNSVPGLVVRCRRCRMCFKILTANKSLAAAYLEDYTASEGIENYMLSEAARAVFRRVLRGLDFAVKEIFGSNHVSFSDDRTLSAAVRQEGFVIRQMKLFPYDPSRPGQPISLVNLAVVSAVELVGQPFGRMFRLLLYARPKN